MFVWGISGQMLQQGAEGCQNDQVGAARQQDCWGAYRLCRMDLEEEVRGFASPGN